MKTSVIITSYCRPGFLRHWFESLTSNHLILKNVEFVVINDGFIDDGTVEICGDFRNKGLDVRHIFTGHRNVKGCGISRPMGYAANVGIKQSTGEIIVLTNSDVYHINDTLTPIISAVEKDLKVIATIGEIRDDDGSFINTRNYLSLPNNPDPFCSHRDMPFMLGLRKQHLVDIGGFDEDFCGYACEDSDLMARLISSGLRYKYTSGICVHLFHNRRTDKEVRSDPKFLYNFELMNSRKGQLVRNQHREWGVCIEDQTASDYKRLIKDFWDKSHILVINDRLTCNSLETHLSYLHVDAPHKDMKFLCVGVGNGTWIKSLVPLAATVYALDITDKVNIPPSVHLVTNLNSLPTNLFDLALSLWVAPHMNDADLAEQLRHVIRSLTLNGVYAIHYNEPLGDHPMPQEQTVGVARAGSMVRDRETFLAMVKNGGGVASIVREHPHPQYQMQMVVAHVRRIK
jgi:GT2 family glycosyltransferase